MFQLFKQIWTTKDVSSAVLMAFIGGIALWVIALPLSTTVQDAYLKRFHLASPNFVAWSIQQTVPSMYNFENRVCFSDVEFSEQEISAALVRDPNTKLPTVVGPVDEDDTPQVPQPVFETINHFPTRSFTFANAIFEHKDNLNGYFYLTTRYRGREIQTTFEMKSNSPEKFEVQRLYKPGVIQ